MTDTRVRALERRWRETGTIEDESAYLVERVRIGDLERSKLELAAMLRHAAAVLACPELRALELRPGPEVDWTILESTEEIGWFREVQRLGGQGALIRVIAAVFNIAAFAHAEAQTPHTLLREQVEQAALSPCEAQFSAMTCHRVSDWGSTRTIARWLDDWTTGAHSPALRTMVCLRLLAHTSEQWQMATQAIREDLVPWLLGYSDPVCERVEAQRREAARE